MSEKPSKLGSQEKVEQLLRDYDQLIHRQSKTSVEKKSDSQDTFKLHQINRLMQQEAKHVDSSKVYQSFRLPGTGYVVQDQRGVSGVLTAEEKAVEETKAPFEPKSSEQLAAEARLKKMFTRFEALLVRHFEEDQPVEKKSEKGKENFLKKTLNQWQGFFARLRHRTVKRKVSVDQLQESIFRDLVQNGNQATLISDLNLKGGQLEKFVRLRLQQVHEGLLKELKELKSGGKLSKEMLAKMSDGEVLQYLAIKAGKPQRAFTKAATRGKFGGSAQTEARVSEELGIPLDQQLAEKSRQLGQKINQKSNVLPWWKHYLIPILIVFGLLIIAIIMFL